jgi:O-antigen/teichoic acid export membrane protein
MTNNIKKDYLWNTIGVLAQNAISPLLLIAVTRLNGVSDSGLFSFAFSLALVFWAIGIWGGRTFQVSDVKREFTAQSYIFVRLLLSVVMLGGAIIFCTLNGYDAIKTTTIIVLVLFKVVESVADAIYGILQVHGRLFVTGRSLLYKAILGFVAFIFIDALTQNIFLSCIGLFGANLLVLFAYDIPRALKFEKVLVGSSHVNQYVKEAIVIMRRCWPIAVVILFSMFSLIIPRYFIDLYHQNEIGYFGILAMPITALGLVITFIIQPNVVRLSQHLDKKQFNIFDSIVTRLLLVAGLIGVTIFITTYFIGVQVLEIIFGVDFSNYKTALMVMVVGAIVNAYVSIYVNILTIMRHFKAQFFTLLFTNIGLLFIGLAAVQQYGLLGGVGAYMAVNMVQASILCVAYRRLIARISRSEV